MVFVPATFQGLTKPHPVIGCHVVQCGSHSYKIIEWPRGRLSGAPDLSAGPPWLWTLPGGGWAGRGFSTSLNATNF